MFHVGQQIILSVRIAKSLRLQDVMVSLANIVTKVTFFVVGMLNSRRMIKETKYFEGIVMLVNK